MSQVRSALGQTNHTNISRLNSVRPQKNNRSGFRGVSKYINHGKDIGQWIAVIYFKRTRYFLGVYDTPQEAYAAYLTAKKKLHENFVEWYNETYMNPTETLSQEK